MKRTSSQQRRGFGLMMVGARSINLTPTTEGVSSVLSKDGVASDWKRVGRDINAAMSKFELERAK